MPDTAARRIGLARRAADRLHLDATFVGGRGAVRRADEAGNRRGRRQRKQHGNGQHELMETSHSGRNVLLLPITMTRIEAQ